MNVNIFTAVLVIWLAVMSQGCSSSGGDGGGQNDELPVAEENENTGNEPPESEDEDDGDAGEEIPVVNAEPTYQVLVDENISYADGLSYGPADGTPFAKPQLLDSYYPENNSVNRPVYMFIHGGGFTGGTKTKPEIVEMASDYASRGWVFVSIDYRTVEELGAIEGMTPEELLTFYKGIAPQEWIEVALEGVETRKQLQQSIAMYAAQRDAKAALRWIVANADTYKVNTDFITVGGASAGAITAITLGITNQEDFRDEISVNDDPTLTTTNLAETYSVRSLVYFWGATVKLDLFELVYGLNRYDGSDPELFMAHGTQDVNPSTPYSEALELKEIYDPLGVYSQLVPLEGEGHGAWHAEVDGKGLFELTFDFLVERQNLVID